MAKSIISLPFGEDFNPILLGGMGATFCHLAALRSAIEFLFWDHWETAVLGQILAGRSREQISAI